MGRVHWSLAGLQGKAGAPLRDQSWRGSLGTPDSPPRIKVPVCAVLVLRTAVVVAGRGGLPHSLPGITVQPVPGVPWRKASPGLSGYTVVPQ